MVIEDLKIARLKKLKQQVQKDWKMRLGKPEYLKYLDSIINNKKEITRKEAMLAACYVCMGGWDTAEAKEDCKGYACPMYHYYPYMENREKKVLTPEHMEKVQEHLKKMQAARKKKAIDKD